MKQLRRITQVYGAVLAMVPKFYMAYRAWVWAEFIVQIVSMTILVFFWRGVYANSTTLSGLSLAATLNYILIAQMLLPLIENRLIFNFGWMIREGQVAIDLLRPMDFQARFYVDAVGNLGLNLLLKVPLLIIAVVFFGLQLPGDPLMWVVFIIALLLGHAVLFFFDWIFSCLAFYSTETWGLERGAGGRGDVLQRLAGAAANAAGLAARHCQCAAVRAVGGRARLAAERHHADWRCARRVGRAAHLVDRAGADLAVGV